VTKEPELITILEGPTPDFRFAPQMWSYSVQEGPDAVQTSLCELRTNTGSDIVARCKDAWREGRPVRLEYPDEMRMRQEIDIVAMRLRQIEEGTILMLWVKEQLDLVAIEESLQDEYDEDDDDFDDEDDDSPFAF
jgi:hypothetical protein